MARNSSVIKIFCRSSLILKTDASRLCPKEVSPVFTIAVAVDMGKSSIRRLRLGASAKPQAADPLAFLALPWLHFILDRLLRRQNDLGGAALGLDLLVGGLRKVMRLDVQLLGDFTGAEDAN